MRQADLSNTSTNRIKSIDEAVVTTEALLGTDELVVRPVANAAEMRIVYRLVHDCYAAKGYIAAQPSGLLISHHDFDINPATTVLIAVLRGEIVGSFSLTLDGPLGFVADADFDAECGAIRREGRVLATGWRLVIREDCRSQSHIVLSLIKELIRIAFHEGVQSLVIEVNPVHEGIYRRLFNMYAVARKNSTVGLQNAPAVLMRCDEERLPARWQALRPQAGPLLNAVELGKALNGVPQLLAWIRSASETKAGVAATALAFQLLMTILLQTRGPSVHSLLPPPL